MQNSNARETLRLDAGWRFHPGDIDAPVPNTHLGAYMANKAGYARGAAKPGFDDSDWREVDLPHDWAVEDAFDPANHIDAGFLPSGVGWYRRYFRLEENDRGKYLAIQFDGVATHCTVYVNGHLLHRHFCGYTPFTIDISDIANFGDKLNVISVRVDATYMEGWWYEGAGIYRHAWLIRTSPVHVATQGVFVNPAKVGGADWQTQIETTVENTSDLAMRCEVISQLIDPKEAVVGETSTMIEIAARSKVAVHQMIPVSHPMLWSCESPELYRLRTEIKSDGKLLDDQHTAFGYRTIRFDAERGFFLNDQPVKLKGTCNHQDHAGVGVAVSDSIQGFRIRRLLEMGSNAYRCAHNPPATELLEACDRLGMLVMDENRNFGSSPEHLEQLRAMVLRDRNHPSVILWSICNEEAIQGEPVSAKIARAMIEAVEALDPSRPVTAAVSGGILNDDCIAAEILVMGINYQLQIYDSFRAKHPHIPLLASETHCALSTRGVYETDATRFVFGSYDTEKAFWGNTARETWRAISSRNDVAGLFAWTGFDYRGEPSPHGWPCINSHWGILDTCGFEKDAFYLHKAWFTFEPFVHLLPHWNWLGKEGQEILVMAYSNCEEIELFLNGESLGIKAVDPIEMANWKVPYRPGELSAVGYCDRRLVAEVEIETTGDAVKLGLEIHPSMNSANNFISDDFAFPITVFTMDEKDRRVPTANHLVSFSVTGPAKILGVGNGDPTCHEPDKAASRTLFNGLAQVIVQRTPGAGEIVLRASSAGLESAELRIDLKAASVHPSLPPARVRHFVSNWRMSAITNERPDANQKIVDSDMNSWERIDPARGPQKAWDSAVGFALYRTEFTAPKIWQATGGRIRFHEIVGQASIYLNGQAVAEKTDASGGSLEMKFPATAEKMVVSMIVHAENAPAGISETVELVAP
ncbi:MAG TPA: beta-galactosidase GalA [Tepidisphaeraceae bacterium]|jgi:beta-galactosidase|nr:beta-galactosidase GalA [Tepidisphaeraceae bacterium]